MFSGIRIGALSDTRKNDIYPVLIIFLLPLLVNLPGLLEWWSVDPIHFVSGLPSLFHGRQMLRGWPWIDPSVGYISQPLSKLAADEWLGGRIPWWNYYSGVGVPLAAEMQPGVFFLPFVLLNHFPNGLLYVEVILQILAGLGTYFLLRKIGLTRLSAGTGAALFQFSGLFAWLGAPPYTSPVAFLPWLIFGVECAREKSFTGSSSGWLIIAVSLAFSIYGGFPETAYIDGLLAGIWSLWRIVSVPSEIRPRFITKLTTGVIIGLLLSTPIVIPFVEYLSHSYLGGHSFNLGYGGLRAEALPQLFFPWLYGSIWAHLDDSNVAWTVWATVGGYLSAAQLAVISLGLFATRQRSLYIFLLTWILVCLGRTFALPFLTTLVDLLPLLKLVCVFRYSPPSWEFCSAVLCAIVIDDITSGTFYSPRKIIAGSLVAFSIATISLYPGWDLVGHLYAQDGYQVFLWISLSWGLSTMALVTLFLVLAKNHHLAGHATAILLTADAIALFAVPSFSGIINNHQLRSGGVNYLKKCIGTNRFYTLGPIAPNYSAYYRIASINHNYLPIAANWVKYIKDHIDPYSDPLFFNGNLARNDPKVPSQAEVLRENIAQYREIGVRYIVTPHGENPFRRTSSLAVIETDNRPINLENGQSVSGEISGTQFFGNTISAIGVQIANYSGKSDGILRVRLFVNGLCALGEGNLKESKDSQLFVIQLDRPITISNGEMRYEITHAGGANPVALLTWPQKDGQQMHTSSTVPSGYAPKLEFIQLPKQDEESPRCVFQSSDMDIYELSEAKPYFEITEGSCDLQIRNRSVVSINCSSEAQLIRRELYYPGWKAFVGGKNVDIEPYNDIFQAIKIPPGKYTITFSYTPTHIVPITASFLLGISWMIIGAIRSRTLDRKKSV